MVKLFNSYPCGVCRSFSCLFNGKERKQQTSAFGGIALAWKMVPK